MGTPIGLLQVPSSELFGYLRGKEGEDPNQKRGRVLLDLFLGA